MLLDGMLLVIVLFPKINDVLYPTPLIVDTPIDSFGLKNLEVLTFDVNLSTDFEIINESDKKDTADPTACDTPDNPLSTLRILSLLNTPITFNISVPMPILLPTDICSEIGET